MFVFCFFKHSLYLNAPIVDAEIVWCQEEPMNMGACMHVGPRLATAMRAVNRGSYEDVKYVGRPPSAATATGFATLHATQQKELVQKALQSAPISQY